MNLSDYVDFISELSKEVNGSHIDYSMLTIDENTLYKTLAYDVIEKIELGDIHIARATILALLVENFTLNLKLLSRG